MTQKQLVLQPLVVEPLLAHPVLIIVPAMTGRAETEKNRHRIADIMVAVGCVQVNAIAFSCAFGCALFPLRDIAKLTPLSCSLLTLPGEEFPIFGILFPPFRFHLGLRLVGE